MKPQAFTAQKWCNVSLYTGIANFPAFLNLLGTRGVIVEDAVTRRGGPFEKPVHLSIHDFDKHIPVALVRLGDLFPEDIPEYGAILEAGEHVGLKVLHPLLPFCLAASHTLIGRGFLEDTKYPFPGQLVMAMDPRGGSILHIHEVAERSEGLMKIGKHGCFGFNPNTTLVFQVGS